jgi:hypothetical protein
VRQSEYTYAAVRISIENRNIYRGQSEDTYVFVDFYFAQRITEAATMSAPCRAVPCQYGNNSPECSETQ